MLRRTKPPPPPKSAVNSSFKDTCLLNEMLIVVKLNIFLKQLFTNNMHSTMQGGTVSFVARHIKFPVFTARWPHGW